MKLNKLELIPKQQVTNFDNEEVIAPAHVQIRMLKPDGDYHRIAIPVDDIERLNDMPEFADAVANPYLKPACDEVAALPETTKVKRLDLFCHPIRTVWDKETGQSHQEFNPAFGSVGVKYKDSRGNRIIAPCRVCPDTHEVLDNDIDALENDDAEVKSFAKNMFATGDLKETVSLMMKKDQPDYQATETKEVEEEKIEVVDGKAVVKKVTKTVEIPLTDEIPCVDEDGNGICDICNTTHEKFPIVKPKMIEVPRMIEGKKVSEEDKARLAELMEKL